MVARFRGRHLEVRTPQAPGAKYQVIIDFSSAAQILEKLLHDVETGNDPKVAAHAAGRARVHVAVQTAVREMHRIAGEALEEALQGDPVGAARVLDDMMRMGLVPKEGEGLMEYLQRQSDFGAVPQKGNLSCAIVPPNG